MTERTGSGENCRLYGKAPYGAIVLHGGPGAPGCAAGLCRGMPEECGVVEHLQTAYNTAGLIAEIAQLIDTYCAGRAAVIGHSFGAWLALLFAHEHPERTERVVVIGCGPLEKRYLPKLIEARNARRTEGRTDTDNYCALPGSSGDMLYFDKAQHIALMAEMNVLRESGELLRRAQAIKCPIEAIHGSFDPHPAEGVMEPMRDLINFKMTLLDRCGHDPWKERYARERFFGALGEALGRGK